MSELSEFYTNRMTIYQPVTTDDEAGGHVTTYAAIHEDVPCRHEEFQGTLAPPAEVGAAPTLVNLHKFFLDPISGIQSGWHVKDNDEANMLRVTDYPSTRRAIDDMPAFMVIVAREVTA